MQKIPKKGLTEKLIKLSIPFGLLTLFMFAQVKPGLTEARKRIYNLTYKQLVDGELEKYGGKVSVKHIEVSPTNYVNKIIWQEQGEEEIWILKQKPNIAYIYTCVDSENKINLDEALSHFNTKSPKFDCYVKHIWTKGFGGYTLNSSGNGVDITLHLDAKLRIWRK